MGYGIKRGNVMKGNGDKTRRELLVYRYQLFVFFLFTKKRVNAVLNLGTLSKSWVWTQEKGMA